MSHLNREKAAKELFLNVEPCRDEREALRRAEVFLGMLEMGWEFQHWERQRAADYLSALAVSSVAVCGLVMGRARCYAEILREYDASPWHPNVIEVLAKGPCSAELRDFLMDLVEKYPGMASRDACDALEEIRSGLER